MTKLVCSICGHEKQVPTCCEVSMIVKDELLCCCNEGTSCQHQKIPECCGKTMNYS